MVLIRLLGLVLMMSDLVLIVVGGGGAAAAAAAVLFLSGLVLIGIVVVVVVIVCVVVRVRFWLTRWTGYAIEPHRLVPTTPPADCTYAVLPCCKDPPPSLLYNFRPLLPPPRIYRPPRLRLWFLYNPLYIPFCPLQRLRPSLPALQPLLQLPL